MASAVRISDVKGAFILPLINKGIEVVFVVDACRSNEVSGGPEGQRYFRQSILEQQLGEMSFIATNKDHVAYEDRNYGTGHGLFTYFLIQGLLGAADLEGDNNGIVSYADLKDYVPRKVRIETSKAENKTKFPTTQEPVFCCEVDGSKIMSKVDPEEIAKFKVKDEMGKILGSNEPVLAKNTAGRGNTEKMDSSLILYYNAFTKALKKQKLIGDSSAEFFYTQMQKKSPEGQQTIEAKYNLAGEFINFGQGKINLYLSGRDVNMVNLVNTLLSQNSQTKALVTEEAEKMQKIITVKYKEAADLMEKAIQLLKQDSFITKPLYPKLWFLRVKSYLGSEDKSISYDSALFLSRRAIKADTNAANNYHIMGLMVQNTYPDSGAYYYRKSIEKAPNWSYPYNELGLLYYDKNNLDSASFFFRKAISIDSTFSYPYNNLGLTYYYQKKYDLAEQMFKASIQRDSGSNAAKPYSNLGLCFEKRNDTLNAIKYYDASIRSDSLYAAGYRDLGSILKKSGKLDQAEKVYLAGTRKIPGNSDMLNDLGFPLF